MSSTYVKSDDERDAGDELKLSAHRRRRRRRCWCRPKSIISTCRARTREPIVAIDSSLRALHNEHTLSERTLHETAKGEEIVFSVKSAILKKRKKKKGAC